MAKDGAPHLWVALEALMQDAGHTITDLGKAAGLSQQGVSMILRGDRRGHPRSIAAIARVYGLTGSQLEATRPGTRPDLAEVA